MARWTLIALLLIANVLLALGLIREKRRAEIVAEVEDVRVGDPATRPEIATVTEVQTASRAISSTPFASIYSSRPQELAANLRQAGCPEETVKDILSAEIGRRYRRQEEDLRPTPGDHLPRGWSARTHEAKIIERRQRAAAMAREKEAFLRQALGYDVKVPMPAYATTVSDQRFDETLGRFTQEKRNAAHLANEQYWTMVEQLRARTKGFWTSEDVEELRGLKAERQRALDTLEEAR